MSEVGDGDCLIRVTHSSVNYKDGLAASGRAATVQSFPLVGGADAVGVIVEGGTSGLVKAADHVVVTGCTSTEPHNRYGTATNGAAARAVIRLEEAGARPKDGPVAVAGAGGFAVAMLAGLGYEVHAFSGKPQAREKLLSYGAAEVQPRPDVAFIGEPLQDDTWGRGHRSRRWRYLGLAHPHHPPARLHRHVRPRRRYGAAHQRPALHVPRHLAAGHEHHLAVPRPPQHHLEPPGPPTCGWRTSTTSAARSPRTSCHMRSSRSSPPASSAARSSRSATRPPP